MLTTAALAFVLVALLFGLVGAWGRRRWPIVLLYAASLGSATVLMLNLSRGPMPANWEWRSGKNEVIAADWIEGEVIWLWIRWPGEDDPRAYRLPWSTNMVEAVECAKAEVEKGEGNGDLTANFPGTLSLEDVASYLEGLFSPYLSPDVRLMPPPRRPDPPPKE